MSTHILVYIERTQKWKKVTNSNIEINKLVHGSERKVYVEIVIIKSYKITTMFSIHLNT